MSSLVAMRFLLGFAMIVVAFPAGRVAAEDELADDSAPADGPGAYAGAGAEAGRSETQSPPNVYSVGDPDCVYTGLCGTGGYKGTCVLGICACENWAQCYNQSDEPTGVLSCGHYAAVGTCKTP